MKIQLPDINNLLKKMIQVTSVFDGEKKTINDRVQEHRKRIKSYQNLLDHRNEETDIKILLYMLTDLLIRAMRGERGSKVYQALREKIKSKEDLAEQNYKSILKKAQYRWGIKTGVQIISDVVNFFSNTLKWNWKKYFADAEKFRETDFQEDELLKIKHIGFKVRDLAVSNFNRNYVANDLHVVRVMTRIGLLNYGFDIPLYKDLEMGNNPGNKKNYLFLHKLVLHLSHLTNNNYFPADLDKIFWSFGRSICKNRPKCKSCPISEFCLTGQSYHKYKNKEQ